MPNQMALYMNSTVTKPLSKQTIHLILYGLIMAQIKQKRVATNIRSERPRQTKHATC